MSTFNTVIEQPLISFCIDKVNHHEIPIVSFAKFFRACGVGNVAHIDIAPYYIVDLGERTMSNKYVRLYVWFRTTWPDTDAYRNFVSRIARGQEYNSFQLSNNTDDTTVKITINENINNSNRDNTFYALLPREDSTLYMGTLNWDAWGHYGDESVTYINSNYHNGGSADEQLDRNRSGNNDIHGTFDYLENRWHQNGCPTNEVLPTTPTTIEYNNPDRWPSSSSEEDNSYDIVFPPLTEGEIAHIADSWGDEEEPGVDYPEAEVVGIVDTWMEYETNQMNERRIDMVNPVYDFTHPYASEYGVVAWTRDEFMNYYGDNYEHFWTESNVWERPVSSLNQSMELTIHATLGPYSTHQIDSMEYLTHPIKEMIDTIYNERCRNIFHNNWYSMMSGDTFILRMDATFIGLSNDNYNMIRNLLITIEQMCDLIRPRNEPSSSSFYMQFE